MLMICMRRHKNWKRHADPKAVAKHMDTVKKHLDSSTIQDLENQISGYDYDEALKTLKRIIENIR